MNHLYRTSIAGDCRCFWIVIRILVRAPTFPIRHIITAAVCETGDAISSVATLINISIPFYVVQLSHLFNIRVFSPLCIYQAIVSLIPTPKYSHFHKILYIIYLTFNSLNLFNFISCRKYLSHRKHVHSDRRQKYYRDGRGKTAYIGSTRFDTI